MSLLEGKDYYLENGTWVFTEKYLKERGYCCQSKCRHCPYPWVISLVPSWTETLLHARVPVVGRTKYCIHPENQVQGIPIVGGTKSLNLKTLKSLPFDCVLFDREENTKSMAENLEEPQRLVTHVQSVHDLPFELARLSSALSAPVLNEFSGQWSALLSNWAAKQGENDFKPKGSLDKTSKRLLCFPGLKEWLRTPSEPIEAIIYLIWRDPWMAVTSKTFIGSVLEVLGYGDLQKAGDEKICPLPSASQMPNEKYPQIRSEQLQGPRTLILFSTEPYLFENHKEAILQEVGSPCALVDGESFSWFGNRTFRFLQRELDNCPGSDAKP